MPDPAPKRPRPATDRAFRRHPVLFPLFLLALLAIVWFGVKSTQDMIGMKSRFSADPEVAGWMTPRYIARTWNIPPEVILESLDLTAEPRKRMTISEIALDKGLTTPDYAAEVEAALDAWVAANR
ncbi:hypothetical protein [Maritimibacter sp. DP1N21-5]|uniref:hypothetical protein n=1 Tax=Maritimibacter sp. DP1N21-5 TaxID=2836867 RepID=UPI001C4661EE|nr:hypothetical protein [Maritimibacter sp. DP1N21-5]MBV7409900.1 hypothetical protein [Maritimibacter sp. DP1N21-5]